jgi:hypothetical protein
VAVLVTTTVPPATTAPVWSVTVPIIWPVGSWDQAAKERIKDNIKDNDNTFSVAEHVKRVEMDMEAPPC